MAAPAHPGLGAPLHLQHLSGPSAGQMAATPASVHQTLATPGSPLDLATRAFMEPRFMSYSDVKVGSPHEKLRHGLTNKNSCGAEPPHNSGLNKPGDIRLFGFSMGGRCCGGAAKRRARQEQWGSKRRQSRIEAIWQRGMGPWISVREAGIAGLVVRRQERACQAVPAESRTPCRAPSTTGRQHLGMVTPRGHGGGPLLLGTSRYRKTSGPPHVRQCRASPGAGGGAGCVQLE